jgi:hypothetical protein
MTKIGPTLRRRLKELHRTPRELADAVQVPPEYIEDLIAGRRRPPLPGRTDLYEKMTRFLRLGRNDLTTCARAEREATIKQGVGNAEVRDLLLGLCEPATAKVLSRRLSRKGSTEMDALVQRLIEVAQGSVRRMLDDEIALRIAATQVGTTFIAMRLRVLEFLDATVETITASDYEEFIRPRVGKWDIDLETGVMRVVLRAQEPRERPRRMARRPAPTTARGRTA